MIICICRGATDTQVMKAIDNGASTLRDLQRCGIGDQCGACHNSLRMMLAAARGVTATELYFECDDVSATDGNVLAVAHRLG